MGCPIPSFYYCGLLPWLYFASAPQGATNVVVDQQRVLTKLYFPRLALPFSALISPLLDFAVGFCFFLLLMSYYHIQPTVRRLLVPVFLTLAIMTALGIGLWLSALNALYVRYAVPFLVQVWRFASPVAYPRSLVPERFRWPRGLNPMVGVIEGFRWALAGVGQTPGVLLPVSLSAVTFLLITGILYFHRMETVIADVV